MRRRTAGQKYVARRQLQSGDRAGDHPAERFVSVRHTFRFARAAGREEDEYGCVGLRRGQIEFCWFGCQEFFQARLPACRQRRTKFGRRAIASQLAFCQVLVSLGVGDDHRGAADFQCVIDFWRLVAIVERSGDEPRSECRRGNEQSVPRDWAGAMRRGRPA